MQDSDLNCALPRRCHNPPQQHDEPAGQIQANQTADPQPKAPPPYYPGLPPSPVPLIYPDTSSLRQLFDGVTATKGQQHDSASPSHTRSGLVFKRSLNPFNPTSPVRPDVKGNLHQVLNYPMVELAGADGHPMLVHRPWTMEDIKQAMTLLPSPSDGGGVKFAPKVSAGYPENEVRLDSPDWAHNDNAVYRGHITDLCECIETAFPVRMDMCNISSCKQDDESVHNYLTCLTEVHNTNSGLTPPANPNDNVVTAWQDHLRNGFLNERKPEISSMVKCTCITWDSGKFNLIRAHTVHAEKFFKEGQKRKGEKREKDL
ncbi:uncharacterized protein LOC130173364 [Seriola aureovittata]|uniref:uncharacterized protein LOC130173364 n=1 Tax=Seriola aureovittata TaxID=2871759 RepID=UPI0024BEDC59|nr:uncharacterized protein LOC130173364 [Seriola aureovittata]